MKAQLKILAVFQELITDVALEPLTIVRDVEKFDPRTQDYAYNRISQMAAGLKDLVSEYAFTPVTAILVKNNALINIDMVKQARPELAAQLDFEHAALHKGCLATSFAQAALCCTQDPERMGHVDIGIDINPSIVPSIDNKVMNDACGDLIVLCGAYLDSSSDDQDMNIDCASILKQWIESALNEIREREPGDYISLENCPKVPTMAGLPYRSLH